MGSEAPERKEEKLTTNGQKKFGVFFVSQGRGAQG